MHIPHPREIRSARIEVGLTQRQASDVVGVSESIWGRWEASPESEKYEVIRRDAWQTFLLQTETLRPEGSGFKFSRRSEPSIR